MDYYLLTVCLPFSVAVFIPVASVGSSTVRSGHQDVDVLAKLMEEMQQRLEISEKRLEISEKRQAELAEELATLKIEHKSRQLTSRQPKERSLFFFGFFGRISALEKNVDYLTTGVSVLDTSVNGLDTIVSALDTSVADLDTVVSALDTSLKCIDSSSDSESLTFSGCNIYIQNGENKTDTTNEKGNLIIGYGETANCRDSNCSRTGSHNLMVGMNHRYTSYGGIVAGSSNAITAPHASVVGGKLLRRDIPANDTH
jgi:hypothetical protein